MKIARIQWSHPNGVSGHGVWMDPTLAQAWVDYTAPRYPHMRHWLESKTLITVKRRVAGRTYKMTRWVTCDQ